MTDENKNIAAKKPARSPWRAIFSLLIVVAMLFVALRVFYYRDIEAFRVSSSSMEPTLLGGENGGGDKILVSRLSYKLGEPKRWDVAAFHPNASPGAPEDESEKTYVKRIVGMPGESLYILSGDIFVSRNGDQAFSILRKPADLQEHLWLPVFRMAQTPQLTAQYWKADSNKWVAEGGQILYDGRAEFSASGVEFTGEITDSTDVETQIHRVGDVRLRFDVTVEGAAGGIAVFLGKNINTSVVVRLALSGTSAAKWTPAFIFSGFAQDVEMPALERGKTHRIELSNVDGAVRFIFDGRTIMKYEFDEKDPRFDARPSVKISAMGLQARFENVSIDRDVYYTRDIPGMLYADGPSHPVDIPSDSYFFLGDNSAVSSDSRVWGCVPRAQIIGKAFLILQPFSRLSLIP